MSAMSLMKFPKLMPKLNSRKIFRSSRENIGLKKKTTDSSIIELSQVIPPAQFIDHTPQRISTISALMYENEHTNSATYCSAHSIDDEDYPSPRQYNRSMSLRAISPVQGNKVDTTENQAELPPSIIGRIHKGYKDVREFRFKHMFAKKTILRKDNIMVDQYVKSYREETKIQEDIERLDNFRFKFKESRQKPGHSYSLSSNESIDCNKSDESIENLKAENATSKCSIVQKPPSTLYAIKDFNVGRTPCSNDASRSRRQVCKNRLIRLTKYATSSIDESGAESTTDSIIASSNLKERKRKAPITPQQSHDNVNKEENTFDVIKKNFNRIHRSFKTAQPSIVESEDELPKKPSRTAKFTTHFRKLNSHEPSMFNKDKEANPTEESSRNSSPIRTTFITKFKKSFKQQNSEIDNQTGDEATPEKQTRSNMLMKNFRRMRSRQSNPDHIIDEHNLESNENIRKDTKFEKFQHARKSTLKNINKKIEKIGFYRKSQENMNEKNKDNVKYNSSDESGEDDEIMKQSINQYPQLEQDITSRAIWTSKSLLSDHTESDSEIDYPRVLIHQDTSNVFESTLVIAVTRSPKLLKSLSSTELPFNQKSPDAQLSMQKFDLPFNKTPPPRPRRLSAGGNDKNKSIFSSKVNSSSEMVEKSELNKSQPNIRCATGLDNLDEFADPWQIPTVKADEPIYKTKSIDIFERHTKEGGVSAAFEDFDEELKDQPVRKISMPTAYSLDRESSEDTDGADDDNSSRITKILAVSRSNKTVISNSTTPRNASLDMNSEKETGLLSISRESFIENSIENNEIDDRPPSASPSPPPFITSTPPPVPERRENQGVSGVCKEDVDKSSSLSGKIGAILAQNPPEIPERVSYITRISKPLVKTSSLRLAYSEQVNPDDVGKVNKLISRFEQPKIKPTQRPRIIPRENFNYHSQAYSEDEETDTEQKTITNNNKEIGETTLPTLQITKQTINKKVNNIYNDVNKNIEGKSDSLKNFSEQRITIPIDCSSNFSSSFSQPNSEYGSPLDYPSSLKSSLETTPVLDRKRLNLQNLHIRKSMNRDDDVYLSFDSDEG